MNGASHEQIAPEILQAILAPATARGLSVNDYLRNLLGLSESQSAGNRLVRAAQTLSLDQRKDLIKALFEQFPRAEPFAGSITQIGDLKTATLEIRRRIAESIERTAGELDQRSKD